NLGPIILDLPQKSLEGGLPFNYLFYIISLILLSMTMVLLINLSKIFKGFRHGIVFVQNNSNYISNIGWIVIILSFINDLPNVVQVLSMRNQLDSLIDTSFSVYYEFDIFILFSGLVILAVAQIFKRAVKI